MNSPPTKESSGKLLVKHLQSRIEDSGLPSHGFRVERELNKLSWDEIRNACGPNKLKQLEETET